MQAKICTFALQTNYVINKMKKNILTGVDARHCTQSSYFYCASEDLKCVEKKLLEILNLGENHQFMLAHSVKQ